MTNEAYVLPSTIAHAGRGGKNASLGEMISQLSPLGVSPALPRRPCLRDFLAGSGLAAKIAGLLKTVNVDDVRALAQGGAAIRG